MKQEICPDCEKILTLDNRADGDPEAKICEECWSKGTPWTPMCEKCEEYLVQDEKNLFRIYCPKCEVESFLVPKAEGDK